MSDNKNLVQVVSCTITELFSEKVIDSDGNEISGTLEIPEYQRPYVWTKKEIDKLLSDIKEQNNKQDEKPMYYLGSIILHKYRKDEEEKDHLAIIDGQQRITTLAIMQHIIKEINKVPKVKYVSPITIEHIKKNHNFLELKKEDWINDIDFENLNVTLVVTENEDDAYTFFETQNTGGVRLSGIDIIKAHHLRKISPNGKRDEQYAITWENQKNIDVVIEQLIKARRWNILDWQNVPSDRDIKGTKNSIVQDFSEKTLEKTKAAYTQIIFTDNYSSIKVSPFKLAIRQPLANGENFIDYLEQFTELYQRLFKNNSDADIPNEYYKFNKAIIKKIDGTAFLKEFYEIAILCYVNKFGLENLLEASFWIFRYTYSLRVCKRMIREDGIPAFIKNGNYIFDVITAAFNHRLLIERLCSFSYQECEIPASGAGSNTILNFIKRVNDYFGCIDKNKYDKTLKTSIEKKIKENPNGK
ncbi:MAG: DUF262 domain-containing protein [Prevotella sp.]|jgi:uncharacterized protein with ParB-like and HNH nuclease domain|nr:DUF262 domain-containing protein [Prevotella sp.]